MNNLMRDECNTSYKTNSRDTNVTSKSWLPPLSSRLPVHTRHVTTASTMPFPVIKLGYEALKQISKPLSNYLKSRAKSSPFFRKYVCMPPAQFYHWAEVNYRLRMLGLGSSNDVAKLSEKEAIELGGDMLGECFVFCMAFLVVYAEYQRGARKEAAKEVKLQQEQSKILDAVRELEEKKLLRDERIREMQHRLYTLFPEKTAAGVKV